MDMDLKERTIKFTKAILMADNCYLAYKMAVRGDKDFIESRYAQDYDILSHYGGRIACELAKNSGKTGWVTNNSIVLALDDYGVAINLAKSSDKTGWTTDNKEILDAWWGEVRRILNSKRAK